MNNALKRYLSSFLVLAFLLGFIPALPHTAQAADNFFIPDNTTISSSRVISLIPKTVGPGEVDYYLSTWIAQGKVFKSSSKYMNLEGVFQSLDPTTITAKVEQVIDSDTKWTVDPNRTSTLGATVSGLRFSLPNLELFPGYNRITLTGLNGSEVHSESFFVSYDDIPALVNMQISSAMSTPQNLNEGTKVVVTGNLATLQGVVQNTNTMKFKVANASTSNPEELVSYPQEDGQFYSPTLTLQPGENNITISIENGSNKLQIKRTVYFFSSSVPFLDYNMRIDNNPATSTGTYSFPYTLNGKVPTVTESSNAYFQIKLLMPDRGQAAKDHVSVKLNFNSTTVTVNAVVKDEVPILNVAGTATAYRLVTVETLQPLDLAAAGTGYKSVTASVIYASAPSGNDYTATLSGQFQYLPGEVSLSGVKLITDYTDASTETDMKKYNAVSLDGAQVNSDSFYVTVDSDKTFSEGEGTGDLNLSVRLMPYATDELGVQYIGYIDSSSVLHKETIAAGGSSSASIKKLYKISKLPFGTQQIRFILKHHGGADMNAYLTFSLNYVTENYIRLDNLYDGQVLTVDSASPSPVKVSGQFLGFKEALYTTNGANAEFFINSSNVVTSEFMTLNDVSNTFNKLISITSSGTGSFHFGQNTILIRAEYKAGDETRIITKSITFYIIDNQVSTVERVEPTRATLNGNIRGGDAGLFENDYSQYFPKASGVFQSTMKSYDLMIKGLNASRIVVKKNGEALFSTDLADVAADFGDGLKATGHGSKKLFYLRIENQTFTTPGTDTYVLELITNTGGVTTQTIQVSWSNTSFTVLSPKPTVGDRIVVNKNFVTVDIQADGANAVLVDGKEAMKVVSPSTADASSTIDHFIYEYVGLKPDKETVIKFQVQRASGVTNGTINVYYTSSVQVGSAYKQAMGSKFSMFNKGLTLEFPKNTILKKASPANKVEQFYQHNLRFGIASPEDGIVERQNDYGATVSPQGVVYPHFISTLTRSNFTRISPVYWISGGVGGITNSGLPSKEGMDPYDVDGTFVNPVTERKLVPTNRGTLTLKFDENVVDSVASTLAVYYLGDSPYAEWQRVGGAVDAKSNTITVPFDDFGYYMVVKLRAGFKDITNHPWARNVLEGMYSKGLMTNLHYQDFGSYDFTTRGEFATLLVKAMSIPLIYDDTPTFVDVPAGSNATTWSYAYIETAARTGIITGFDNQQFGPSQRLTREQAATMIARAMELKLPKNDDKVKANLAKQFTDVDKMSYYALPAIQEVSKQGIMLGMENAAVEGQKKATYSFSPLTQLKRDEAAQIAVRLLQKNKSNLFPSNLN